MSVVTYSQGKRETVGINLADTNVHTLVSSEDKTVRTLESLVVSCGGSATGFSLIWNDGTTDFNVVNVKQIAANDIWALPDPHLLVIRPKGSANGSLKVQASAGNQLCVTAVVISAAPVKSETGAV